MSLPSLTPSTYSVIVAVVASPGIRAVALKRLAAQYCARAVGAGPDVQHRREA